MLELDRKIMQWGIDRDIHTSTAANQAQKTIEEVQELVDAIDERDMFEMKDAIGDIYVTLQMICLIEGIDIEDCKAQAYNEIKDRKGKMVDGIWQKEN